MCFVSLLPNCGIKGLQVLAKQMDRGRRWMGILGAPEIILCWGSPTLLVCMVGPEQFSEFLAGLSIPDEVQ